MKKRRYHTYHVSFIDSVLKNLAEAGISYSKVTRGTAIRNFDLSSETTYLPLMVCYEFLGTVKKRIGLENVARSFYSDFKVGNLSDFGTHLSHCPDLYAVLLDGMKYNYLIQTNGKLHLDIKGSSSYFYMQHVDEKSFGRRISERIELLMMLEAVRMVLGKEWIPNSITITGRNANWLSGIFESDGFQVYTNSPYMGFSFPTELLNSTNPGFQPHSINLADQTDSLSKLIRQIMSSTSLGYLPNLNEFAMFFGVSRRTLIRSLASEGCTFSNLLEYNLQNKSIAMLKNPRTSIKEVSQNLGYSNSSNFIRAFRNWTEVTPEKFREEISS